jgi:hypothetical protein
VCKSNKNLLFSKVKIKKEWERGLEVGRQRSEV